MPMPEPDFELRLARDEADRAAAARLRYAVFVEELGAPAPGADHAAREERDRFDPFCDHLLLVDRARGDEVVGLYRLLDRAGAAAAGGFYTEGEYDLGPLLASGRELLELGRSCLHPDYRGGAAMYRLWHGLSDHVAAHGIELLFGTASFHGTDVAGLAEALSNLHHGHLAPPELRVRSRRFQPMDLVPCDAVDRRRAMLATPALIKAYLRLGGWVGEGAFVDRAFNTTDVCLILDTARLNASTAAIYTKGGRA